MRSLSGFRDFFEFQARHNYVIKQNYGNDDNTNPPEIVSNTVKVKVNGEEKHILAGTTIQKITPDPTDTTDPKRTSVTIKVLSYSDPNDPLKSATGHGRPSELAGQELTIPYDSYLFMIQPGQAPSAMQAMGGQPGMGGM